jgi:hypothetical protein
MSESRHTTERLKQWRTQDLKPDFVKTLDKIEEFGWQTWSIFGENVADNFAYTVGTFDTLELPELITIGLPTQTGASSLNRAIARMREGADLTKGRFRDIVGEVEVEFLPVDPKWLHHAMLRTDWYYEGADVPVLQLVYPDLENRFQWENGFTDYFSQPMLAPGYPEQLLEQDFWASQDRVYSVPGWPFADPPYTRALLSQTVHDKEEPITYVSHEAGVWRFMGDKMTDGGGPVYSRLLHPLDADVSLVVLADLPIGWYAIRSGAEGPWERFEWDAEEDEDED